jgi:hypothetical protein
MTMVLPLVGIGCGRQLIWYNINKVTRLIEERSWRSRGWKEVETFNQKGLDSPKKVQSHSLENG